MLLTNHTLTGVFLGLSIDNPVALAPTAVASHLVLDAVPHFGASIIRGDGDKRRLGFLILGSIDFALSVGVTVAACVLWPWRAGNIIIGALGADLPDLTYIPIILFRRGPVFKLLPFYEPMQRFFSFIQWYEKPPGAITEVLWFALMAYLLGGFPT
jgi:hypothetical protein